MLLLLIPKNFQLAAFWITSRSGSYVYSEVSPVKSEQFLELEVFLI
jgi:hypothetical protein